MSSRSPKSRSRRALGATALVAALALVTACEAPAGGDLGAESLPTTAVSDAAPGPDADVPATPPADGSTADGVPALGTSTGTSPDEDAQQPPNTDPGAGPTASPDVPDDVVGPPPGDASGEAGDSASEEPTDVSGEDFGDGALDLPDLDVSSDGTATDVPTSDAPVADVPVADAPGGDPTPPGSMPAPSAGGGKLAFAHYFTPFGLSDNKPAGRDYYDTQWLTPTGEKSKHAAYGGFLRDRPLPRSPLSGDYQSADMATEIGQAQAAGLDGFTLDLLSADPSSYNYQRVQRMLDVAAAHAPGFRIMLMPDMAALRSQDADTIAALIAHFGADPAAFRLADGRLVVSPFLAENHSAAWWSGVLDTVRTRYGIDVAFVPTFLDWRGNAAAFAPISYGFSNWGGRNPTANRNGAADSRAAHVLGKLWMQPVSVQDERPRSGIFDEAGNTENLRASWAAAIGGDADWVQYTTWNDYSEGTSFAPSVMHGWSYLSLSARYLTKWRTGAYPGVTDDVLWLSHRRQFVDSAPRFAQSELMHLRRDSTPARDTVEVFSWLTAPGTVSVTVGASRYEYAAPAGPSSHLVPLAVGDVSARLTRDGQVRADVRTPAAVTASPLVQDLQYVAAVSD